MAEVADIFRRFADGYLAAHGGAMPPSHKRAIWDILSCRSESLGGHLWRCNRCGEDVYSYHSCKNRSCPKCHTDQAERWLKARQSELLPCHYFHITVTVPDELREPLRSRQKTAYPLLMKAAAQAIIELARDPRYVGGDVGVLAVLHTWTQQLLYHPHVHCLATGGGVSNGSWRPARQSFLFPCAALAKLVRGKLLAMLAKRCPELALPKAVWRKPWVVHCTPSASACGCGHSRVASSPRRACGPGRRRGVALSRPLCVPRRHLKQPDRKPRQRWRHLPP
jgi:hypothetical protein